MRSDDKATDAELIADVLDGNQSAFSIIVRRYEGAVAATVIGMLGPGDEAEEVGQETMIKLYRSLDRFKGEAELKTYLTRIAINSSLDALRRRKRNLLRFFTPESENDSAWEDRIASASNHTKDFENRQLVQAALEQLKPEFRAVAVLRLVQGYSVEETADMLDIAPGTVLSRLSRARKQLMEILKPEAAHAG